MTWSPLLSQGFESRKIWPLVTFYAQGRGLDMGCGPQTCLPHMIGVEPEAAHAGAVVAEAHELYYIADGSLDFIFSSHMLEHLPKERVPEILEIWARKLRVGGRLILYLPDADEYPKIGEEGSNPDHKWDVYKGDILEMLRVQVLVDGIGHGWKVLEQEKRNKWDEYSLFEVYEKTEAKTLRTGGHWRRHTVGGKPRALVFRLGAIGDCCVAFSTLKMLHETHHVTVMTSAAGAELLEGNPYADVVHVATKDMFPRVHPAAFFEAMKERYDRVINLDRSLEDLCLAREDNYSFNYPLAARQFLMGDLCYYDVAHEIAGVPLGAEGLPSPAFFPNRHEMDWARNAVQDMKSKVDGPVMMWALSGSSFFKVLPSTNVIAERLANDGVNIIFTGDGPTAEVLEAMLFDTIAEDNPGALRRLYPRVGRWTLRQSCAMAMQMDCVVGPETGLLHAVGFYDVQKVMYLSHSSVSNFGPYFHGCRFIMARTSDCPCHPCHQIHNVEDTCTYDRDRGGALCMTSIDVDELYRAIRDGLAGKIGCDG